MDLTIENILLIGSILLFISIVGSKTSYRFGVPTLILFLLVGILAGSEGLGRIHFDDLKIAQFIGIVALNFILFSGGFETDWKTIKPVLGPGIALSTLGVILTAVSLGTFVWAVTDFTIIEGLLLGSIVSSTDAAAVFSILRSKNMGLKGNLRPTLELESGSNDPTAYFLTIAFTGLLEHRELSISSIIPLFFTQLTIGTLLGLGFGKLNKFIINSIKLDFEGLYPVLLIALIFITFSATNAAGGNGFLALYLMAVMLGNEELVQKKTLLKAFDGFAWLMQIVLFLTLGLLVFPSQVIPLIGTGLLLSAFLIIVARPLSVFCSLAFFKLSNRKKLFISWAGLRGAVPIVFATYPLLAGLEKANVIFNLVFFISLTSVLIQGTSLSAVSKKLGLHLPYHVKRRTPADLALIEGVKTELHEIILPYDSPISGQPVVDIGFPKEALISVIQRNGHYITPKGSTILYGGDKLLVLSEDKESIRKVLNKLKLPHI